MFEGIRMRGYKSTAAALMVIAAVGFTGCNGHDRDHDRDRDRDRVDEHRDPHRDDHPCDHVRDPHCDDRPR
jgi:hypothetical protein